MNKINKDILEKYLVLDKQVRVYTITTTNVVNDYLKDVKCTPVATAAIGRLMTATLMMGSMLKGNDNVVVSIQGNGELGKLMAQSNAEGYVRGFVENPLCSISLKENNHLDVGKAVGNNGFLTVKKQLNLKEPFVGTVPLVTGEIGDDLSAYFLQSEQTPTVVALGVLVDIDYSVKCAGGFIIQLLPNPAEETIKKVEELTTKITSVTDMLLKLDDKTKIINLLFDDFTLIEAKDVSYKCSCSQEYAHKLVTHLNKEDIEELIKENQDVEVVCNFCNKKYYITIDELRKEKWWNGFY